jgi:5-methylcytosine-specific restriction endonuclease McrBC regulatory subunit McrC
MYAYGKKYETSKTLYLIYPKSAGFTASQEEPFHFEEGMTLRLLCFDCEKDTLEIDMF